MSKSIFKVKGIPVQLHFTWFIAVGFITWSLATSYYPKIMPSEVALAHWIVGSITALSIFVSVFLHELAHTFYAVKRGIKVSSIKLHIFGGIAKMENEPRTPKDEILLALAGPGASFLLGIIFYFFDGAVAEYLTKVNIAIGIFNLLPAYPLDGGRVIRALLWRRSGDYIKATEKSYRAGIWFSTAMMSMGLFFIFTKAFSAGIWFLFLGGFLRLVAESHYQGVRGASNLTVKVEDIMMPWQNVRIVEDSTSLNDFIKKYFLLYGFHNYPVVTNGNKLIGILSYHDFKNKLTSGEVNMDDTVASVMRPYRVISYSEQATSALREILLGCSEGNCDALISVKGETPVGFITKTSIMRAISYNFVFDVNKGDKSGY